MSLTRHQKVNHFPNSKHLTRKDFMYTNIKRLKDSIDVLVGFGGGNHFKFLPLTFCIPDDLISLRYAMSKDPNKFWIVKPANSSSGQGIFLTKDIKDVEEEFDMVVCEYIANPFLINGFKFDLRIYVAVTSINPLRVYVYEDGLTRFATEKYHLNSVTNHATNKYIHLTNSSVNKGHEKYQQNTDAERDD